MLTSIYIAIILIIQSAITIRCEDPPLKTIYDVVPHFKEVHACNRIFTTSYRASRNGVRIITFTGSYRKGETAGKYCRCRINFVDFLFKKKLF